MILNRSNFIAASLFISSNILVTANATSFDCENIEDWNNSMVYTNGDQVDIDGHVYQAKWWSKNQTPSKNSTRWAVWKPLGECVASNQLPFVSLISPLNNDNVEFQQTIQLIADASDADGRIQQVDFYINGQLVGSRDSAPYQIDWQANEPVNSFNAIATDDQQAQSGSETITFNVVYPSTVQLQVSGPQGFETLLMEEVSADHWQTTSTLFTDESNLLFMVGNNPESQHYGDIESDFIADLDAPEINFTSFSGQYKISFNTQSLQYNFERKFKQTLPSERNFEALSIHINNMHTYNVTPMTLIADNIWEVEVNFDGQSQYLFEVDDAPNSVIYGDIEGDRTAEKNAPEIIFNGAPGNYIIRFNDKTNHYTVEQNFTTDLPFKRNMEALKLNAFSQSTSERVDFELVADHIWQADFSHFAVDTTLDIEQLGLNQPVLWGDNENDGIAEANAHMPIQMTGQDRAMGNYAIRFNDENFSYTLTQQFETELPYARNMEALTLHVMSIEGGHPVAFELVDDHTWIATFIHESNTELDIEQLGLAHPLLIGDNEQDGIADRNGLPISLVKQNKPKGKYSFYFNDQTFAYDIIQEFETQLPYQRNMEAVSLNASNHVDNQHLSFELIANHIWQVNFVHNAAETTIDIEQLGLTHPVIFGDNEQDGIAEEFAMPIQLQKAKGNYQLRFNDQTLTYDFNQVFVAELPFERSMEAVMLNVHAESQPQRVNFELIGNHIWEAQFTHLDPQSIIDIEQLGLPQPVFFGDNEQDNIADEFGQPILLTTENAKGTYFIRFNDQTLTYEIKQHFDNALPYKRNMEAVDLNAFTAQNKQLVPFELVSDNTWQATFTHQTKEPIELFFEQLGLTQPILFGDNGSDGKVEEFGTPILFDKHRGDFSVSFNDKTLQYSIEQTFVKQMAFKRNMEQVEFYNYVMEDHQQYYIPFVLTSDHTWEVEFPHYGESSAISITQLGLSEPLSFGDSNNDFIAEEESGWMGLGGPIDGTYKLTFNDQTLVYSIEHVFMQALPYKRNMEGVRAGLFNNTGYVDSVHFDLIADHTWQAKVIQSDTYTHFDITQNLVTHGVTFGDNEANGFVERNGKIITIDQQVGNYTITFNDKDMSYVVERVFTTPMLFQRNFETIEITYFGTEGTFPITMSLVSDNTWETVIEMTLEHASIRIDATNVTTTTFGDSGNVGVLNVDEWPVAASNLTGRYVLRINDQTLAYELIKL
ncbi:MAG: hypothetical protein GY787_01655 [Alteromonadales bacterium]|nr:hypothetical protein [Alteromonadales bacterium]